MVENKDTNNTLTIIYLLVEAGRRQVRLEHCESIRTKFC